MVILDPESHIARGFIFCHELHELHELNILSLRSQRTLRSNIPSDRLNAEIAEYAE